MNLFSVASQMLGHAYGLGVQAKNFLYETGLADQITIGKPVMSIGNISMGGTGKTPIVEEIISICLKRGLRPCVVARNYKAESAGIHLVDLKRAAGARFYGDEAFAIALKFPQVPVFTGPLKSETARFAEKEADFDLLLVDDAFQHRALHRDFDLVLIDTTASQNENKLFPLGKLREGFNTLSRASLIVLTKVNWASKASVVEIQKRIPKRVEHVQAEFFQKSQNEISPGSRILAVSGIAKPLVFEQALRALGTSINSPAVGVVGSSVVESKSEIKFEVVECLRFSDHHAYNEDDVTKIIQRFRLLDCQQILTTEKDFVKLREFPVLLPFLNPVEVNLKFKTEPEGLYAFLDQCSSI